MRRRQPGRGLGCGGGNRAARVPPPRAAAAPRTPQLRPSARRTAVGLAPAPCLALPRPPPLPALTPPFTAPPPTHPALQVWEYWGYCGAIEALDLMTFPDTGRFRGIAFITFQTVGGWLRGWGLGAGGCPGTDAARVCAVLLGRAHGGRGLARPARRLVARSAAPPDPPHSHSSHA